MLNRQKSSAKDDIRSKIRHENVRLGGGTEMGGLPANQGLHNAAFASNSDFRRPSSSAGRQMDQQQPPQQYAPLNVPIRQPDQYQQQQQQQQYAQSSAAQSRQQPDQYQYASANVAARMGHQPTASTVSNRSYPAPISSVSSIPRSTSGEGLSHHQHRPNLYGTGPSFISLSPSDSISNFEGRPGVGLSGLRNQPFEASAESTASFAQGQGDFNMPLRPARSIRRQGQHPSMERTDSSSRRGDMGPPSSSTAPTGRNLLARKVGGGSSNAYADSNGSTAVDRHARSARLMAQVMNQSDGRATPNSIHSENDSAMDHEEVLIDAPAKSYDSQMTVSPPLGSLSRQAEPAVLGNVLNALTQAGRKKGQARILRGTTAEEESRRRKSERKLEMARSKSTRPLEHYIDRSDEKAFREICAVLRKVKEEWGFVVEDDFNGVSLALSLMDDSSLGASKLDFADMKEMIETSLQGTVDDHYESFATAISLHNNVLQSLGSAQNGVSAARRRLRGAKEALGAKRADLVQLWNRSQVVKDSLRLLDTIETLKGVPDRLESLMSEKRFLEAVNLLMRSLKMIAKSEIAEVGATADLRGYLKGQEQAMFDILVEELHNHLYLKSFYCDSRWRPYTRGQNAIPNVDFGKEYDGETGKEEGVAIPEPVDNKAAGSKDLKIFHYLKSLADRPTLDLDDMPDPFGKEGIVSKGLGLSHSIDSSTALSREADAADQLQGQNPESDSFLYIEMLLESLARLGKLKLTQDILQQRLTMELHQLVDSTIDEVDARNEMLRRSSVMVLRPESLLLSNSSALARSFADNTRNSFRNSNFGRRSTSFGTSFGSSFNRLSAVETSRVDRDNETMRDLFWTLFSKLDAVLQGHRVVFEVITKISSRGASSAYKAVKIGKPASLLEVWRPIQNEVRTLLYEYLMDDAETTSARRNILVSVNEILRHGTYQRDRTKGLYKLIADAAPKTGANLGRKDFAPLRRHEEALTNALRASVPGLVGAMDAAAGVATGGAGGVSVASFQQQSLASATRGTSSTGGHKLLVKPDAFNISVLFQPALAFIDRVKMLLPVEASGESDTDQSNISGKGFSTFLDEFVKDVFLNQLEDKVQGLLSSAVGGSDAFQEDRTAKGWKGQRPIVRSSTNIIVLIDSLYSMLRTTPFHRESYSQLIVQVIVSYYQHCHERFRHLITIDNESSGDTAAAIAASSRSGSNATAALPSYVVSATWARLPMIMTCLVEAVKPDCEQGRRKQLFDMENKLELNLAAKKEDKKVSGKSGVSLNDLTSSRKKLTALGNLQNSMIWVFEQLQKLKATDEDLPTTHAPKARLSLLIKPGSSLQAGSSADEEAVEEVLKLPMRHDMAARFQALPKTFEHLSHIILFTLRLEIRARTIYHLDLAINEGNYLLEDAVLEPDPQIVDLNAELAWLDDIFADTLLPRYHNFLFAGLASLMDLQLCQAVRKIRYINRHGLTKMIRNILALQQNLRNIVVIHETSSTNDKSDAGGDKGEAMWRQGSASSFDGFEKSNKLWELIGKEPEQLLSWIRKEGPTHSFEDYKSALNLILGLENGPPVTVASPTVPTGPFSKMMAVSTTISTPSGGPALPGANLKPGTTLRYGGDVSRQKLNEYLIELHDAAGGPP